MNDNHNFDSDFRSFLMNSWFEDGLLNRYEEIAEQVATAARAAVTTAFGVAGGAMCTISMAVALVAAPAELLAADGHQQVAPVVVSSFKHGVEKALGITTSKEATMAVSTKVDQEIARIKGNIYNLLAQVRSGRLDPVSADVAKLADEAALASKTSESGNFLVVSAGKMTRA